MLKKGTEFISVTLIIVIGLYVYSSSLNGKFIWDDNILIKNNAYITNPSQLSKIFTENVLAGAGEKSTFYRPLQIFTYMLDYSLWKLNAEGYHLTNILLHILATLGIYWFINVLWKDKLLSLFTSILFVTHPLHTEAVTYISGRADSLAALFMLLCLILYIKQISSKKMGIYILMLFSYILALLSKEYSLILPALLLLYHYTFKKKVAFKEFVSLLSIAFIYVLLRSTVLVPSLLPHLPSSTTLLERIPGFFVAMTNYARLTLLPFNLHMEYENRAFNFISLKAIVGFLILTSLLIYAVRVKRTNKLVFFSISWFFIALLPVSNLYPVKVYIYMAEHWLYFPSIGLFLILAKGLSSLYRIKNFRIFTFTFAISLVTFYSHLTIRQNEYWKEPIAFYKRTLKYAPNSWRIYNNLGYAYSNIGNYEEAIALYKKAIEINPEHAKIYNNLAYAYSNIGNYEEAIALYKKAIEINPDNIEAYNNLAVAYYNKKQYNLAIEYCDKAINLGCKVHPEFLKHLEPYRK